MRRGVLIIGICILGVFIYCKSTKTSPIVDDILLKNIEALADIENSGSILPVKCVMTGETKCPHSGSKVMYVVESYSLGEDEEIY